MNTDKIWDFHFSVSTHFFTISHLQPQQTGLQFATIRLNNVNCSLKKIFFLKFASAVAVKQHLYNTHTVVPIHIVVVCSTFWLDVLAALNTVCPLYAHCLLWRHSVSHAVSCAARRLAGRFARAGKNQFARRKSRDFCKKRKYYDFCVVETHRYTATCAHIDA